MRFSTRTTASAAAAALSLAVPSLGADTVSVGDAGWHRTEWRASTFERSTQSQASLAVDRDGRIVVVWSSRRQQDGRYGVYAQRFDSDGVAIGAETCINLWTDSHQWMPSVAVAPVPETTGDGCCAAPPAGRSAGQTAPWVVWQSHGQDGDAGSIIARRFAGAGRGAFSGGDEIAVDDERIGHQSEPLVIAAPSGGALVVWTAPAPDAPSRVRARLLDPRGRPLGGGFGTCEDAEVPERVPGAAFAADGSFVIAYAASDALTREPTAIRLQRFDETGHPLGAPIDVGEAAYGHQVEPAIVATRGGFALTWLAAARGPEGVAADWAVVMRTLDRTGRLRGEAAIVSPAALGGHSAATIAADGKGRLAVAYNRDDGEQAGIFARLFSADGAPIGGEFRINARTEGPQAMRLATGSARLAFASSGSLLCAWSGDAGRGDSSSVNVTMLSPKPVDLAGREQGVTEGMQPAPAAGALAMAGIAPEPHQPPKFDPRAADERGERRVTLNPGGLGFDAILNTGWTPPDCHMAVGPEQVLVMTNGEIAAFSKSGEFQWNDEIENTFGFWGELNPVNFVFDPEVLYDPLSERYFAMASESQAQSHILIAVSTDSTPTEFSWHKYRFNTSSLAGGTYDSPNIAVDADTVYITGDAVGQYPVFVFDKASLLAGVPPVSTNSFYIGTFTQSAGIPPVSFDNPPALYMVEHGEDATNNSVRLIALRNALGSEVINTITIGVPSYGRPEDPPQMGTSSRPETFDARFWSVAYRNGSLWATHHVDSNRVLARWYEFAMNGWPTSGMNPTLVQSGNIDVGPGIRTFFSSITVDPFGNAAICYARSSLSEFISMATSYRYASDPLGTFGPSIIHATATSAYTAGRWGDYSEVEVDPADGKTMWAHHEYAQGSAWRTWVQQLTPVFSPADVDCDGVVGFQDLLLLLAAWGPCAGCPEDIDGNGMVDFQDLLQLLAAWTA